MSIEFCLCGAVENKPVKQPLTRASQLTDGVHSMKLENNWQDFFYNDPSGIQGSISSILTHTGSQPHFTFNF